MASTDAAAAAATSTSLIGMQVGEAEARRDIAVAEWQAFHETLAAASSAAAAPVTSESTEQAVARALRGVEVQKQEWRQMAENARAALKADEERRIDALTRERDTLIADRDARIEQLQGIVATKERVVADLYQQIAAADDNTQTLLRTQRRELAIEREQLKEDALRLSGHRERMRVQSEAAINARDAQKALAESVVLRAAAAERTAGAKATRQLEESEQATRARITEAAEEFFALVTAVRKLTRGTVIATEKNTAGRLQALRATIAAKDAADEARHADAPWSDAASSSTDGDGIDTPRSTTTTTSAAGTPRGGGEVRAHRVLLRREKALAKTLRRQLAKRRAVVRASGSDIDALRQNVASLVAQLEQQSTEMELLKHSSADRVDALIERCGKAEARVASLRQEHADSAGVRAKARSQAGVLETLLAEHDEETAELRRQLAEAEDRARCFARENKHDALDEATRRAAALKADRDGLATEVATLRAKVSALQATTTSDHTSAAKLTAENRRLMNSVVDAKSTADTRVGSFAAACAEANQRASAAEEEAAAATARADQLEVEHAELTVEHNRVRDHLAKVREQLFDAEQRASDLERGKRLAIDREQARSRDRCARRQAAAAVAEEEAERRRIAADDDDGHPQEDHEGPKAAPATTTITATTPHSGAAAQLAMSSTTALIAAAEEAADSTAAADEDELNAFAAADAAIEALETKLLLAKRERDTLRRQLGVAMAEVSAAEERRANTVQKYLALLNSSDAAPRRELALRQQETSLRQLEAQIIVRTEELDRRELETKKREIALGSKSTALTKLAKKLDLQQQQQGGGAGGYMSLPMRSRTETGSVASAGQSTIMSPSSDRPSKLTPLLHRPPAYVAPPNLTHPQLPPRATPRTPPPASDAGGSARGGAGGY